MRNVACACVTNAQKFVRANQPWFRTVIVSYVISIIWYLIWILSLVGIPLKICFLAFQNLKSFCHDRGTSLFYFPFKRVYGRIQITKSVKDRQGKHLAECLILTSNELWELFP